MGEKKKGASDEHKDRGKSHCDLFDDRSQESLPLPQKKKMKVLHISRKRKRADADKGERILFPPPGVVGGVDVAKKGEDRRSAQSGGKKSVCRSERTPARSAGGSAWRIQTLITLTNPISISWEGGESRP